MKRIFRHEVPVDDERHEFCLSGPIVGVGARKSDVVEFWAVDDTTAVKDWRAFQVVGTGQPLPDDVIDFHGHVVVHGGALVWHLIEVER
jgi:hypothetical protein